MNGSFLDKLNTGNPAEIAHTMYGQFNVLQLAEPATQVQALSLLFILVCSRYRLDLRKAIEIGQAIINDAERTNNEHIAAARRYIEGEL